MKVSSSEEGYKTIPVSKHYWNPFLRFPIVSLLLTAVLSAPLLVEMTRFEVSSETELLLEGDQRNLSSYEKVKQILSEVEVLVISMEYPDVFTPEGIDAVRRVSVAFERQPGVVDVKSLTHSSKPVRRGFSFEMVPLIPQGTGASNELEELKEFSLQHPLIRDVMVASDSKHTIITVTYDRDLNTPAQQAELQNEIEQILAPFRDEGLRFQTIALPLIEHEIRSTLRADILAFLPAAVFLLTTILWVVFRSWRILLLVFANQAAVLILFPGLIRSSGYALTVFTILIFPLLTGIHLTLLIHVFTSFQRAAKNTTDTGGVLERMLREIFKPCLFSALTTGIGLLSLTLSDVRPVREFGILGAMGIGLIFFVTFGPGLAVLNLAHAKRSRFYRKQHDSAPVSPEDEGVLTPSNPISDEIRLATVLTPIAINRPAIVAGIAGIIVIAAVIGIGLIRTDIRAVEFLNPRSPTRTAVEEFDKVYGGINVVQLDLDSGVTNGVNSLPFLKYVESIQEYAESKTEVSGVYSYAQLLAMINQIWEGGRSDALKLPENVWLINLFAIALKAQNFPFLTALADPDLRTANVVIRTPDMPSEQYLAIVNDVVDFADKTKPESVSVSAASGVHSILEADRRILRSQRDSALTTLLVVGAVLALLWRSPSLALLSLLTNALPVAFVVALAGYVDVPLNSITIMVAAIALGISVDDSIHFITHWRECRSSGKSTVEAIQETIRIKGKPIVSTSVILISILTVFCLSSFPPVVHFGLLSAAAFAGALAGTLLLLPAMLCLLSNRQ